jgi:4'-phosphopantetheinyl transferase
MDDYKSWAPNSKHFEFEDQEIHVWRAYLDCEELVLQRFDETLAPEEKARADRFIFRHDRNRYVAARGALRELLGRYLDRSPAVIEFDYTPQGKPSLRAALNERSIQFNVSHSRGLALLTFALGRNLGIDVEFIRPEFPADEVAQRYFSRKEVMELRTLPPALRSEGFYLCWTRKEAYMKATGEGLHVPLESFSVSLTPGLPERLESADSGRWSMRSLYPDPLYAGALVAEGQPLRLRQWSWEGGHGGRKEKVSY